MGCGGVHVSIWFEDMGRILFQVRVNLHHNDSEVFPHKRTRIPKTCILLIYSLMEQYYWLMYACLSKTQITFPMKITVQFPHGCHRFSQYCRLRLPQKRLNMSAKAKNSELIKKITRYFAWQHPTVQSSSYSNWNQLEPHAVVSMCLAVDSQQKKSQSLVVFLLTGLPIIGPGYQLLLVRWEEYWVPLCTWFL